MAEAFKDFPNEAKELILRQHGNKAADIIVSKENVDVIYKNRVNGYFPSGYTITTYSNDLPHSYAKRAGYAVPDWYNMELGTNRGYYYTLDNRGDLTQRQKELCNQSNPKPYKIFQVAEEIADDIEARYFKGFLKKPDREEADKVKQLTAALTDLVEYID